MEVITIPTHKPIARADEQDQIYQTEIGKFKAIAKKIKEVHSTGQPILIGTISIERNELLSEFLKKEGVPHTILNAKKHESEGEIIAGAGAVGSVTIATNMAGRGIDIKLGGELATKEEGDKVRELGGLFVLGTERHESRRIDNQLRGRAGRQGDLGKTQFFVSLDDDLMRVFGGDRIKAMMGRFGIDEDQPIQNKMITSALENAQTKIEGFNFDSRKKTLEYDNVLSTQRTAVYARRKKMLFAEDSEIKEYLLSITSDKEKIEKIIVEKVALVGEENFWRTVRRVILHVNDVLWTEHLENMDYVRSAVNLRAYGQREPLIEYTKEGLILYRNMEAALNEQVLSLIDTIRPTEAVQEVREAPKQYIENSSKDEDIKGQTIIKNESDKIGRNDIVVIEKDGQTQEIKFKKAESLIAEGWVLKGKK